MAGPLSSFREASSACLVGDTMRLRAWCPSFGRTRLLIDDIVGQRLCHPGTMSAGLSLATAPERQQRCPVPAVSPVRPPPRCCGCFVRDRTPSTYLRVTAPI
ncbi:hypothetical protein MTO96_015618 [Rhipicephalus appendiculatus]